MRENGVDSPYLFLHCNFSIVASLAHPEGGKMVMDLYERKLSGFAVFVPSIPVDFCNGSELSPI